MAVRIPRLTKRNEAIFFGMVTEPGTIFTYSPDFLLDEVRVIAKRNRLEIEYQIPKTDLYKKHGCFTCIILGPSKEQKQKSEKFLFDPEELVL